MRWRREFLGGRVEAVEQQRAHIGSATPPARRRQPIKPRDATLPGPGHDSADAMGSDLTE